MRRLWLALTLGVALALPGVASLFEAHCTIDDAKAAASTATPKIDLFNCSMSAPVCQAGDRGVSRRMIVQWNCGSAGVLYWRVFTQDQSGAWKSVWTPPWDLGSRGGKLSQSRRNPGDLTLEEPIYRDSDADCCPSGGTRRRRLRWKDGAFVVLSDSSVAAPMNAAIKRNLDIVAADVKQARQAERAQTPAWPLPLTVDAQYAQCDQDTVFLSGFAHSRDEGASEKALLAQFGSRTHFGSSFGPLIRFVYAHKDLNVPQVIVTYERACKGLPYIDVRYHWHLLLPPVSGGVVNRRVPLSQWQIFEIVPEFTSEAECQNWRSGVLANAVDWHSDVNQQYLFSVCRYIRTNEP
jgi:hypothetical protein